MYKKVRNWLCLLAAVMLLAGCESGETVKEMTSETTAGTIDIVVENADGSQLVLKSERSAAPVKESTSTPESTEAAAETTGAAEAGTAGIPVSVPEETMAAAESSTAETAVSEESSAGETTAPESSATAEDGFVSIGTVRCISDGARIRETPRGTILGNCSYGDILQVDGERTDNGWVHVKSDVYGVGYIFQEFIQ